MCQHLAQKSQLFGPLGCQNEEKQQKAAKNLTRFQKKIQKTNIVAMSRDAHLECFPAEGCFAVDLELTPAGGQVNLKFTWPSSRGRSRQRPGRARYDAHGRARKSEEEERKTATEECGEEKGEV